MGSSQTFPRSLPCAYPCRQMYRGISVLQRSGAFRTADLSASYHADGSVRHSGDTDVQGHHRSAAFSGIPDCRSVSELSRRRHRTAWWRNRCAGTLPFCSVQWHPWLHICQRVVALTALHGIVAIQICRGIVVLQYSETFRTANLSTGDHADGTARHSGETDMQGQHRSTVFKGTSVCRSVGIFCGQLSLSTSA